MSERSGQTAKGKDGKTKYASLNLFDTYKGKSLETQKPVVPPRHGLQSLGKVASARRMPPPANLPSLKAENKGNDPNISLVPKDGTGWASKQEPADPKSTDVLSAPQLESQPPVASQTPVLTRPRTPTAPEAPASALAAGARSWAQASVTHGVQGDGGKGSNQPSPFSREEFPTLQAAGDQDRAGREPATADQWYGPGPSLRPQNVTSWRDGGGRALNAVLPGEGAAEGGAGGASMMEGAAGAGQPASHQLQNLPSHGPPRNPPSNSPGLPLAQPPVGPQFPAYRGIMPPFMYPPYLPFPPPYGPQGPYRYPPSADVPRFARAQGGAGDGRPPGGPRGGGGEMVKRPSILKQDDLKELDELDHDGDEGWAGAHEEIDYSAKLKFSDDEGEEEGEEERTEGKNCNREQREQQQRTQEGPASVTRSRGPDSGGENRRTPPSGPEEAPQPPSSKSGWAEEGAGSWAAQGHATLYQGRRSGLGGPREQPSPPPGPLLGQAPYSYYRQDRPAQPGSAAGPSGSGPVPSQKPSSLSQQQPSASPSLLTQPQAEDEDETWRQRRKQSYSEISAAVERARRRREEEERRMEEERRAACAEKLKKLDEKQQQQSAKPAAITREGSSPGPTLSTTSPTASQPSSPSVDSEEPPLAVPQAGAAAATGAGTNNRQRAGSNSSYESSTEPQQCPPPPAPQTLDTTAAGEGKEEASGPPSVRGGGSDMVKVESLGGGSGRQPGGLPSQGYSKYQKSLPPRFQRQQQEQLLKQQQQWQQQQQHNQAAQNQLQPPPAPPQGPAPGAPPQPAPKQPPMYPGTLGRPPPLPMNFDPRWVMMPYMDPRMMQGRPPPMDYYPPSMHPSGLLARERSDSGGSGSDPFDRQQPHPGPPHPHRGTPPMDPKLAWGPDVFPGGTEPRGLGSPLRQNQQHEDDENSKGLRSDTPPTRLREGGTGPIQQGNIAPSSPSASSTQTPPPPLGSQGGIAGGVAGGGGSHLPHHHQSFVGGRGNYSSFPDNGSRGPPHQQQRGNSGGSMHSFSHQDESSRGVQQGQIWGAPHPHYDHNGCADLSPLENNPHLHLHHPHHPHPSHFPLHSHKTENGRDRERGAETKKSNPSPPLHQPCLSSSCSSSSSSSSARDDNSGKLSQQPLPPQHEHDMGVSSGRKQEKVSNAHLHSTHSSLAPPSHHSLQHHHPKSNQRGREHKTETQWGPRPGSNSASNISSHNRKSNTAVGSNAGEEPVSSVAEKSSSQSGGSGTNKRAGPIKRPVLREIKREGVEGEGEKIIGGSGKDKEQDCNQQTTKQDAVMNSHASPAPLKDDSVQMSKSRNGGKERTGGVGKGPKEGDTQNPSSGYPIPTSRRDRDRSFERSGGGAPPRGSRAGRGRGEFYGRGRGYRGTYSGGGGGGSSSRGRAGGRSSRDYRSATGNTSHHAHPHGSSAQDSSVFKGEVVIGGRQGSSQMNPGRARNRSETRSEGSEYEEVPKRRRQRGSETGSESAASDLAHSDKEDRKQQPKNGSGGAENPTTATSGGANSTIQPRTSQTRVFTPRGVPSRRGRGGGGGSGSIYRSGGSGGGGITNSHRTGPSSTSHGWASKSSVRKQVTLQSSPPKDVGRGGGSEKKDKVADSVHSPNQNTNAILSSNPAAPSASQLPSENGNTGTGVSSANTLQNSTDSTVLPPSVTGPEGRGFSSRGFERPPRRRRHGRSQHQQDKPPRFRRLKQERENAARINGGTAIIGGGAPQQRPTSPSPINLQAVDGAPITTTSHIANHNSTAGSNNSSHQAGTNSNLNSHHPHHHYNPATVSQHHHNHNPVGGAKSPDVSNQNSDQANEEWETASESSDFTEFREREGGGAGGGGRSYSSHHHHHPSGRGGNGGGGAEREMTAKESAANKRSFSSQRPGMERQNRRVNAGGGGRGPRGPTGGSGGSGPSNGSGNRGDRRGNFPSPKNRK